MSIYALSDVDQASLIVGGGTVIGGATIGGILNAAHETNSTLLNTPTQSEVFKDLQNIKNIHIVGKIQKNPHVLLKHVEKLLKTAGTKQRQS